MIETRPPTVSEAAGWLKQNEHCQEYCLACLKHWRAIVGDEMADAMEARAPSSSTYLDGKKKAGRGLGKSTAFVVAAD